MSLSSLDFAIVFNINGDTTISNNLQITSAPTSSLDISHEYVVTAQRMNLRIDAYVAGVKFMGVTMDTTTFVSQSTADVVILQGLEAGTTYLTYFGNISFINLVTDKTTMLNDVLATFDLLSPDYSGNEDQTYLFWLILQSFQAETIDIFSTENMITKIKPTITAQQVTGGVATTRPTTQTLSVVSSQMQEIRDRLPEMNNNATNLSVAVTAIGNMVTGYSNTCSTNQAEINSLRAQIAALQRTYIYSTPEQQFVINQQIIAYERQIAALSSTNTGVYGSSTETVRRMKTSVDTILGNGENAKITFTGEVVPTTGYPELPIPICESCPPCNPCNTCPTTCPTTTTCTAPYPQPYPYPGTYPYPQPYPTTYNNRYARRYGTTSATGTQIYEINQSILAIERNQALLTQEYNALVAAGTVTSTDTQAYTQATMTNQAQIQALRAQLATLTGRQTTYWWNWNWWNWNKWNTWNWTNTSTWWTYPSYRIGTATPQNSKKNLHTALRNLATIDNVVLQNNPSTQGTISYLNAMVSPQGTDAINMSYSLCLNDEAWTLSIQNMSISSLKLLGSGFLQQALLLSNSQQIELCNMFQVPTSGTVTRQQLWRVFLVAVFTYIPVSLFVLKQLQQANLLIESNLDINVSSLMLPTSINTMSNGSIPFFAKMAHKDTFNVMNFGIFKALTVLMLYGNSSATIDSSDGLTTSSVSSAFLT